MHKLDIAGQSGTTHRSIRNSSRLRMLLHRNSRKNLQLHRCPVKTNKSSSEFKYECLLSQLAQMRFVVVHASQGVRTSVYHNRLSTPYFCRFASLRASIHGNGRSPNVCGRIGQRGACCNSYPCLAASAHCAQDLQTQGPRPLERATLDSSACRVASSRSCAIGASRHPAQISGFPLRSLK